jgi:hypothetical protein
MLSQITDHHQGYTILTSMIAADILLYIPSDDLTQRDYGTIHETMKKVLLQTKQLYLEWGRKG